MEEILIEDGLEEEVINLPAKMYIKELLLRIENLKQLESIYERNNNTGYCELSA